MIQKFYGYLAVAGLALFLLAPPLQSQSVSTGGAFLPIEAQIVGGVWTWVGNLSPWVVAGTADDGFETTFTFAQPTASHVWTVPATTDTVVGLATTDTFTNKTLTAPTITSPSITTEVVTAAGGTETLTSADCGQTVLWDTGTGSVVTLPAATGTGCIYKFITTVDGEHGIDVVGNDEFIGSLTSIGTTADNSDSFVVAGGADNDRVLMNQGTTGGLGGGFVWIQDISTDNWAIWGVIVSTDASATPFSTGNIS